MTIKVKVSVYAEFAGATDENDLEEILEFEDNATEETIDKEAKETAMQLADEYWSWQWERIDENETQPLSTD